MIKTEISYLFNDKKTFENKVLPYIFGGGLFYKNLNSDFKLKRKQSKYSITVTIKTNTLSQLITAITGMLRYSSNSLLYKVEIIKTHKVDSKLTQDLCVKHPILGVILKPALSYKSNIIKNLIKYAIKNKIDFVKDDDISDYSLKQAKQIKNQAKKIIYFQKTVDPSNLISNYVMIVPWINGWTLLEDISKKKITMSHCANLSPQISWYSHIIFSRLAGATLVIVPDPLFDNTFNLNSALDAATKEIIGVKPIRIIISGGINPKRISNILKSVNKKHYQYIGFAAGSWLLSSNNINKNIFLLKRNLTKFK